MNWSKGFTAKYYAAIVDPKLWRDISTFNIDGGSVKLNDTGLRESADIRTKEFDRSEEIWIRVYMEARQEGEEPAKVPIFTGLANSPNRSFSGNHEETAVTCYSVLKPADDILLPLGWYARAGSNGGRLISELLSNVTPAPVIIDGITPAIDYSIVAESGETHLTMVDYILDVIGWRMYIDGLGQIIITEPADGPSIHADADKYDILSVDVSIENDWFECPNVFRAVADGVIAIAKDEDPDSRFSIQNRGREIWMEESGIVLSDQESIGEYAKRRLSEEQFVSYSMSYTRRFHPDVRPTDMISVYYPKHDISGIYLVTSQTIDLSYGAPVSEEVWSS